jgi:hypothetical protein
MSIGLLDVFGPILPALHVISQIGSSYAQFYIWPPFELHFGRKPSISHLRPFGCRRFALKCGNLDKFEHRSSDIMLLGYTPHDRSYIVFNLETNTIIESCDMIFNETIPYPHDVFECAGDKKMEENIFVDEELESFDSDENKPLLSSTFSPKLVSASTLKVEITQVTTSSTVVVEAS